MQVVKKVQLRIETKTKTTPLGVVPGIPDYGELEEVLRNQLIDSTHRNAEIGWQIVAATEILLWLPARRRIWTMQTRYP